MFHKKKFRQPFFHHSKKVILTKSTEDHKISLKKSLNQNLEKFLIFSTQILQTIKPKRTFKSVYLKCIICMERELICILVEKNSATRTKIRNMKYLDTSTKEYFINKFKNTLKMLKIASLIT